MHADRFRLYFLMNCRPIVVCNINLLHRLVALTKNKQPNTKRTSPCTAPTRKLTSKPAMI